MLLERHRERVAPVLVGEHVVQVLARSVARSGSPGAQRAARRRVGAGLSAAWIEARPGLAIGVGGSPVCRYVLYGRVDVVQHAERRRSGGLAVEQRWRRSAAACR